MSDLSQYYQMIENCIQSLGVNPATTRGQQPGSWRLVKGSASVYIDCWHIEREGRAYFQVMSPIMKIPESRKESFYFDLLSFNDKLFSCAFTLYKDWAWLKVIRECDGLDPNEAMALITRIGNYADQYDDMLKQHYEGQTTADANLESSHNAG